MSTSSWARFGWDGISLRYPAEWELVSVTRRGRGVTALFAGEDGRARATVRWEYPGGRFDLRKAVSGIERAAKGASASDFESPATLPGLKKTLSSMREFATFRWRESDGTPGMGFLGSCARCGRASVVQVFERSEDTALEVLSSFEDHPDGEVFLWEAFDVAIEMPAACEYSDHGYDPRGLVRLAVRCPEPEARISYFRWALGRSHIESCGTLEAFFKKAFRKEFARFSLRTEHCTLDGHDAVTFAPSDRGVWRSLRAALRLPPPRTPTGVIWYNEPENRIYAVALESRAPDALAVAVKAARRVRPAPSRRSQ